MCKIPISLIVLVLLSNCSEPLEKVVYKDKIIYKDKFVDRIVEPPQRPPKTYLGFTMEGGGVRGILRGKISRTS